ncbi:ectoine/hydroxyectoine ABC transporter permease subunit EhuD [Mesorhizobium australicum]|uniref:ectoine/hydroxyectoine ABC transporter permease subunit EhuD n=1 Tax=Mesorhizobium australicum TaxID=536018 RepID=UPI003339860A
MEWDWQFALQILPDLARGALLTVQITVVASALAICGGFALFLLRISPYRPVSMVAYCIIEAIRRTPLLLHLYMLFYMLPSYGILLSPLTTGIIGIAVYNSAYLSEAYRGAVLSVNKVQIEAAVACNLGRYATWRYVIIPQALPPVIPVLGNYVIAMLKETPILSAITVLELMGEARVIANYNYRYLEPFTLVGVFFLLASVPAMIGSRLLERMFGQPIVQ